MSIFMLWGDNIENKGEGKIKIVLKLREEIKILLNKNFKI